MPRLSTGRINNWSSQPSSPRGRAGLKTLEAASTKTSRTNSPSILSSNEFSQNFFKTSIRINYTTVRKLHKGFYGDVLLVNDKRTEIKKVIKEFKKSIIQADVHKKFIMDIQKFQGLDHPNVVKLLEVCESRESWLLVYEFFSGSNLLDKANEIIGDSLACSIIEDILSGLNYCHRNGIPHLGLNLEKIILDSRNEKINCKIIGFSYPWELEDLVKINEVTCFMAPEILTGVYNNPASDIWSVGVILYVMTHGKLPFRGKSSEDLLKEYRKGWTFKKENWILASNELEDLLSKMLNYDHNTRITVEEVLNHPWLQKNSRSSASTPLNNEAITRLVEFTSKDKIARELFSFFKVNLTNQNDHREFIELFKNIDKNKDGQISQEELLSEIKNLDIKIQNRLKRILKRSDLMEKGYIEFSEFLTACTDWNTDENIKKFEKAFKLCDKSGDGQLSLKELKASIKGIRSKEWAEFFGSVDFDRSGTISFEELKEFLFGKNRISPKYSIAISE